MRRELILLAVALLAVAVLITVALGLDGRDRFTERNAEATVTRALKRCDSEGSFRRIECRDIGDGFACRADGRLVATFDEPDPEDPELSVMC
ncbi:MAG: hypothetical protein ACR2IN_04550 [Thermoleophilaceae bacterium]